MILSGKGEAQQKHYSMFNYAKRHADSTSLLYFMSDFISAVHTCKENAPLKNNDLTGN